MARVPRRSISIRLATYERLLEYGRANKRSCSDVVEKLLAELLGIERPVRPAVRRPTPSAVGAPAVKPRAHRADRFTFGSVDGPRPRRRETPKSAAQEGSDVEGARPDPRPSALAITHRDAGNVRSF